MKINEPVFAGTLPSVYFLCVQIETTSVNWTIYRDKLYEILRIQQENADRHIWRIPEYS